MKYTQLKVFPTANLPQNIFDILLHVDCFEKDGYAEYTVGYIEGDTKEGVTIPVDNWLKDNGAKDGEIVLIYHGVLKENQ